MDINGMSMLKRNFKYSTLATAICLLYAPTTFAHIEKVETDSLTVIGATRQSNNGFSICRRYPFSTSSKPHLPRGNC